MFPAQRKYGVYIFFDKSSYTPTDIDISFVDWLRVWMCEYVSAHVCVSVCCVHTSTITYIYIRMHEPSIYEMLS